jgi:hypothetical protein
LSKRSPEVEHVGGLELRAPNLKELVQRLDPALVTPERAAHAEWLEAWGELKFAVGCEVEEVELVIPAVERGPAGQKRPAQEHPPQPRARVEPEDERGLASE